MVTISDANSTVYNFFIISVTSSPLFVDLKLWFKYLESIKSPQYDMFSKVKRVERCKYYRLGWFVLILLLTYLATSNFENYKEFLG